MSDNKDQKLLGYTQNKGIFNYIKQHINKYNLVMSYFIGPDLNIFEKILITIDFVICAIFLGAGINDYFQYNFYKKRFIDRKNFIVGRKWIKMVKKCNGSIENENFDDKSKFNKIYSEYLGRQWLDTKECSFEEFDEFTSRFEKTIYKMKSGSGGNGIGIYDRSKSDDIRKDFENFNKENVILEELIIQHKEMAKFNPSSVNTIRVVTILQKDKVNVMSAIFRTGNGKGSTDNFHHFGLAALIDVETGLVYTPTIDKKNQKFIKHPISKEQIIGFEIPYWDKIIDTVTKAAKVDSKVKYVGWDIAIREDGTICIIEGNCSSDPDIAQMPDQIGKWKEYKKVIDNL